MSPSFMAAEAHKVADAMVLLGHQPGLGIRREIFELYWTDGSQRRLINASALLCLRAAIGRI
jgi:hypothetical protein